jgi:hypothetical protein
MWWRVVSTLFLALMAARAFAGGHTWIGVFFATFAVTGLILAVLKVRGVELPRPER